MNMHVGGAVKTKFKVGDRVSVLDNMTRSGIPIKEYDVGSVYAIERICGDGEGGDGYLFNGHYQFLRPAQIELAPKFAVGDKVRLVKDGMSTTGAVGKIATIDSWACGKIVDNGDYLLKIHAPHDDYTTIAVDKQYTRAKPDCFEPYTVPTYSSCAAAEVDNLADEYGGGLKVAAREPGYRFSNQDRPAPGDRVSIGEQGTFTVKDVTADGYIHFADRPRGLTWMLHDNASVSACTLVQAATTFRIEAGKFYKTRDGRKALVGVNQHGGNHDYPFFHEVDGKKWHGITAEGKSCIDRDVDDIIAEWQDEPAAKFKVGDKVRIARSDKDFKQKHIGREFTISEQQGTIYGEHAWIGHPESSPYVWASSELELLTPAPTTIADLVRKHAIVAVIEDGQPKPATRPYVHADRANATTEADRLANANKGQEFGVYELVSVAKVKKTYDHEWQRLAARGSKIPAIKELRDVAGLDLKQAKDAVQSWIGANL